MARSHKGGTANAQMTKLVIQTYGNRCWLQWAGCTGLATTKDHVVPAANGGADTLDNFRPACRNCNGKRRNLAISGIGGMRFVVLIGPPAAGKTTHVLDNAGPLDIVIDLDAIARALMPVSDGPSHEYPPHVRHVAIGARKAALDRSRRLNTPCTVWIIHAMPDLPTLAEYRALHYRIEVIDPGRTTVDDRARTQRPERMRQMVARWYDLVRPQLALHHPDLFTQEPPHADPDDDPDTPARTTTGWW